MSVTDSRYSGRMGRWKNDARTRLQGAALELYALRGFEQTTVADIAARAGLTERSYFRHFADKREVLFAGGEVLLALLVQRLSVRPPEQEPLVAVVEMFEKLEFFSLVGRPSSRQRQKIIEANAGLQERELMKLAALAAALSQELQRQGVAFPAASLAAETGMLVFRAVFGRWLDDPGESEFGTFVRAVLAELREMMVTEELYGFR